MTLQQGERFWNGFLLVVFLVVSDYNNRETPDNGGEGVYFGERNGTAEERT